MPNRTEEIELTCPHCKIVQCIEVSYDYMRQPAENLKVVVVGVLD